jgi:hypothetical protein
MRNRQSKLFSQQLEDFQKAVPHLNKSIQDSIGIIDSATDVDKARAEIDGLRASGITTWRQGARPHP